MLVTDDFAMWFSVTSSDIYAKTIFYILFYFSLSFCWFGKSGENFMLFLEFLVRKKFSM